MWTRGSLKLIKPDNRLVKEVDEQDEIEVYCWPSLFMGIEFWYKDSTDSLLVFPLLGVTGVYFYNND
jgi:hypothetical protein